MPSNVGSNANLIMMSKQFAIEKEIDFLSEALAYKGVSGYQASKPHFEEHLQSNGTNYLKYSGKIRDISHGPVEKTGLKLDVATNKGYFAVMTPSGVRYTRNGHYHLSPTREVINADGYPLLNEGNAPIVLKDAEDVSIGYDGTISTSEGVVGRLKVVEFNDEQAMSDEEQVGYFKTSEQGKQPDEYRVMQGYAEGSNVDTILTLSRFSMLSHRWQDSHQVQKKHDEMELEAPSKLAPVGN